MPLAARAAPAGDATSDTAPAPESTEELDSATSSSFEEPERRFTLFPGLKRRLANLPPFIRDASALIQFRTYWLDRRNDDATKSEAWAIGGSLDVRSGRVLDIFSVGAVLYTSQRLHGPRSKDGTLLLRPRQRSLTVLGQAYVRAEWEQQRLTLYRQALDLPYVNRRDNRMVPITFEGYTLTGAFDPSFGGVQYVVGWIDQVKLRDDDEFRSMSEAAGVPGSSDKGMALGGARWQPLPDLSVGGFAYYIDDVLATSFAEVDYKREFPNGFGLRFQAQFTDQRSVGRDRLTGSSFDTRLGAARLALSYGGAILTVAGSTTHDEAPVRSPFGSNATYLSLMQSSFNRADEDAWLVGLSWSLERYGLPGISGFVNVARGNGAVEPATGDSLPDQTEYNATLDFRPERGFLRGFWLRLRSSIIDFDGGSSRTEHRIIFNYDLPVL